MNLDDLANAVPAKQPAQPAQSQPQPTEEDRKNWVGYVEDKRFAASKFGYFCGTCAAFKPSGGRNGNCTAHQFGVKSYGCCNTWKPADQEKWIPASGRAAEEQV